MTDMSGFVVKHGGVGILNDADVPDLKKGVREAFLILKDGEWHSSSEIKFKHRHGEGEALRRVRDLRPLLGPLGYTVEKRRGEKGDMGGSRLFWYRIAKLPFKMEFSP